jgi:addiction module antitoxin, RelB/DinJ family
MQKALYLHKNREAMAQTAMTIRMDNDLKVQFDALCDEFGMSTNTAFNIFARMVVRKRRIPFIIEAPSKEEIIDKGKAAFDEIKAKALLEELPALTLEEINEEIRKARAGK